VRILHVVEAVEAVYAGVMDSLKKHRVDNMVGPQVGHLSPYYTGFFERFNRQEFFEAHDVLEQLWLQDRQGPNGAFYKGLIQLAGAFVHVQKKRRGPALALLRLAEGNLSGYRPLHERLEISACLELISLWRDRIGQCQTGAPELAGVAPHLHLNP
jgi:hypothetical protein